MAVQYVLSEYIDLAMAQASYDKLEDDSFVGRIPACKGVIAFRTTLRECQNELRSTLEDWVLLGLKLGHPLPIIGGIDLNKEPAREPVDSSVRGVSLFAACVNLDLMALSPVRVTSSWSTRSIASPYHLMMSIRWLNSK